MEPTDFERGFRAVGVLDTLKLTAEFLDVGAGTPQGGPLLQRRHRLPHLRLVRRPERHRRHPRHAGRHHDGRARQRELLHDRSARARRHDQRVHGDGGRRRARAGRRCPRLRTVPAPITADHRRRSVQRAERIDERADAVAGQPARARRADRRHRVGQHELADQHVQPDRAGQQPVLRARLLPADASARRPIPQDRSRIKRPGLRVAARRGYGSPRGRTAEERKRDEEARRAREAKRPNADKTSTAAARHPHQPAAAERAELHRACRAVQEHAEGSVGRAGHRDRRRPAAIRGAQREGHGREQDRAVVLRHQRSRQGAGGHAHGCSI